MNIAAGVLKPTSGHVFLDGNDISGLSDRECSDLRNRRIGYIPRGHGLLQNLTVLENVELPRHIGRSKDATGPEPSELLERVGLSELSGSYPRKPSGGEQRRASIVRALVNSPGLIIADEPTSDLDSDNSRNVMELLRSISDSGMAILLVTHETDSMGYGDRILRMDGGRLKEVD